MDVDEAKAARDEAQAAYTETHAMALAEYERRHADALAEYQAAVEQARVKMSQEMDAARAEMDERLHPHATALAKAHEAHEIERVRADVLTPTGFKPRPETQEESDD